MKMINYKTAGDSDCKLIYDLALEIWNTHYIPIIGQQQVDYMLRTLYSEKSLMKQMKDGQEFTLIFSDDVPIGYFSLSRKGEISFLHKFYIDSRQQSKGIGTEVMKEILMRSKGAIAIELTVNRKNFKTINFYFKNGFYIKSVEDFDIGEGFFMNDFIMRKDLS
jgi:GNAT superfamily N-acetyltransferase